MTGRPSSFMPFFVGDYLRDTMTLTRSEHGGYMLLLMAYWAHGGPLADNDRHVAAIAHASTAEWRNLRPILSRFFDVREGHWHHKRVDHELNKAVEAYERRKQAGALGNASAKRVARNADAMRPQSEPQPQPQDLSPSGSSRRGSRARLRDETQALPAPPAGPDWSDSANEAWHAFKAQLSPSDWRAWFAPCRLGEDGALIAPSRFTADTIAEKFGEALTDKFGPITITSEERKAAA